MNNNIGRGLGVALGAASMLALANIAEASTLAVSASYGGTWLPGSTVVTFDSGQPANVTFSGGAAIVSGSASGLYAAPWVGDANGGPDQTPYVSVFGGSAATFTLSQPSTYLGVLWGSVDVDTNRNLISFYRGEQLVGSVQGSDIASLLPDLTTGGGVNWFYQGTVYANITSPVAFDRVVFQDLSSNSFEFDNVAVVPLPMALPLFASVLIGLGAFANWREA